MPPTGGPAQFVRRSRAKPVAFSSITEVGAQLTVGYLSKAANDDRLLAAPVDERDAISRVRPAPPPHRPKSMKPPTPRGSLFSRKPGRQLCLLPVTGRVPDFQNTAQDRRMEIAGSRTVGGQPPLAPQSVTPLP